MKIAHKLSASRKLFVNRTLVLAIAAPILFGIASAAPGRAQSKPEILAATTSKYEYEVASIKLSKPAGANGMFMGMRYTDDGLTAQNLSLMLLIQQAYGVGKDRITGAPDWLNSERYDIDAKVDGAAVEALKKLSPDELKTVRQHMLQALLADRFSLTLHRETKELAVYNLVIAKNGPKLQESKPEDKGKTSDGSAASGKQAASGGPMSVSGGGGGGGGKSISVGTGGGASVSFGGRGGLRTMSGRGVTIENLLTTLASATGRPVLDKTGLTGKYDYKLEYAPEDSQPDADSTGPSIFTALQEQLGLKLESGKGPVEIIVIDRVERPSGN
jgi:uncharacterized protein (TIGR03435 family)